MSALPKTADRLVAALRGEPPLDDLKKARLEKQLLAAVSAGPSLTSVPVPPPRRRTALAVGGVVALAAAAALVVWARTGAEAPRYAISSGGASREALVASAGAVQAGTELALAAGESAEVELFDLSVSVRERSHLRVEAVSLADVRLSLSSGEARFAFHPRDRGHQHVAISTPAARVEIVGTELTVRATALGTDVEVHEGVVRVIPADGEAMLVEAGRSVTVPARVAAADAPSDPVHDLAPDAAGAGPPAGLETSEPVAGEVPAAVEAVEVPTDAELIARGTALLDRGAFAEVERTVRPVALGGAPRADRAAAWRLIGEARRARHDVAGALDAYEHEVELSRGDDRATAIYERARLLERAGETERARTELARYLAEHPDGPNAATARARLEALGGAP